MATTTSETRILKEINSNADDQGATTRTKGAAEKPAEASKEATGVHEGVDTTANESSVCRFVIQNLKGGKGHTKHDYHIELLVQKHSLLDLVVKVFEILRNVEKKTEDSIHSHLWSIVLDGQKYDNGGIDEHDPQPLADLDVKKGSKGFLRGESASFSFFVESVETMESTAEEKVYPKHSAVQQSYSSSLSDDWVSVAQKQDCLELRRKWSAYWGGESNASKRCRRTYEIIACKPLARGWTPEESELLGLLINAGHKFKKSWKAILQYAMVERAESATSGQWYKLQKEGYRLQYIGKGKTPAQQTLLAKKLAQNALRGWKDPPSREDILAERERLVKRQRNLRAGIWPSDDDDNGGY